MPETRKSLTIAVPGARTPECRHIPLQDRHSHPEGARGRETNTFMPFAALGQHANDQNSTTTHDLLLSAMDRLYHGAVPDARREDRHI